MIIYHITCNVLVSLVTGLLRLGTGLLFSISLQFPNVELDADFPMCRHCSDKNRSDYVPENIYGRCSRWHVNLLTINSLTRQVRFNGLASCRRCAASVNCSPAVIGGIRFMSRKNWLSLPTLVTCMTLLPWRKSLDEWRAVCTLWMSCMLIIYHVHACPGWTMGRRPNIWRNSLVAIEYTAANL